ncbi:hypothetical protein [Streptomyces sp. TP-A0356]|uniref:hypothetical protein n=1 Tax=Streptomyces sp. TP-A0356 TaxID=1359208 RepID=UPI0006E22F50|nr:hypothetical protein [Streptomyces sp. TP-A0356]
MDYRSTAVTTAIATGAAMVASGITYASTASEPMQAASVQQAVTATAPQSDRGDRGDGNEGRRRRGYGFEHEGRIHINERDYAAFQGGCVTVVSGLGATSLNIRNDSRRTVEVFDGANCDNGAPITTVGPHSTAYGVTPAVVDGIIVTNGVVGSFRVVGHEYEIHSEDT